MGMISGCRVCAGVELDEIINLGNQPLSGVFPKSASDSISAGELQLMRCANCGLVQLGQNFPMNEMYGENYGYRSGLNVMMVEHLTRTARGLLRRVELDSSDIICDIGSNDGTFLNNFTKKSLVLIGIDPSAEKYRSFYSQEVQIVSDFFTAEQYFKTNSQKAKIVTSLAMFYDLESPVAFAKDVNQILAEDGHWVIEMSYSPWMQYSGAYDTICHEHLEYYSLSDLIRILDQAGFYVQDVSTNSINGGSLTVFARKHSRESRNPPGEHFHWLLKQENLNQVNTLESWVKFSNTVRSRRDALKSLILEIVSSGKSIYALGASTKGNVLLSYSEIGTTQIPMIGEVNPYKYGRLTPGTHIPIVPEEQILELNPDYLLFLPWHFRENALAKYAVYLAGGGKFIFPLPSVEVLGY